MNVAAPDRLIGEAWSKAEELDQLLCAPRRVELKIGAAGA
jgi:hypothetical protein